MKMNFVKSLPILFMAIFTAGCSDENGFASAEEEMDNAIYEQDLEKRACREGTSTHSDSWCCSNYDYQCDESSSSSQNGSDNCYTGIAGEQYYQGTDPSYDNKCLSSSSSQSEATKCYYGTSTHTDYWCCSNYGYRCTSSSSSSYYYGYSSSSKRYYTEEAKTLKFTLTNYEQLVKFDDESLSDGDPKISFTINLVNITGDTTKKSTGTMLSLSNQGSWSGTMDLTFSVPANTERISVCPKVLDVDVLFDDDYSSGYCYYRNSVGRLDDYEKVYQSDYESEKYDLEWEWYLY